MEVGAGFLLQEDDGEDVGGRGGHRDDVRAERPRPEAGGDAEGVEHLALRRWQPEVRRQQRPLARELLNLHV